MREGPVLVTAPCGNVGRAVVKGLMDRGVPVRAAIRDPTRVALPDGVEIARFDFEDPTTHAPALTDVRGLFLLRPTQITRVQNTLVALVEQAQRAGVRHCALLSVAGAERQPWLPHRKVEKALEQSSIEWTFLRANHFMQNFLGPYRRMVSEDRLRLPCGDGKVSFVDCEDLGEVAAMALTDPSAHAGRAYHLTGPEALGFDRVAELLSTTLERPVRYERVGPVTFLRELRGEGAPLPFAAILTALHLGIRRGSADEVDPTLGQVLGRPPHSMAEFFAAHSVELGASPADVASRPWDAAGR